MNNAKTCKILNNTDCVRSTGSEASLRSAQQRVRNKLHSAIRVAGIWLSMLLINVAAVFAQEASGLFGGTGGSTFLTLGIFILIIFFIGDRILRQMRGKK